MFASKRFRSLINLPLALIAVAALLIVGCSSDDDDSPSAQETEQDGSASADGNGEDTTANQDEFDSQVQLSDAELEAGLAQLTSQVKDAGDMCDMMAVGMDEVLMHQPETESQAQAMLEFHIAMYDRMAELVEDEDHRAAIEGLSTWFQDNLSGTGNVLETLNSDTQLEGLATPEVEAAMSHVGMLTMTCEMDATGLDLPDSPTGETDAAGETD